MDRQCADDSSRNTPAKILQPICHSQDTTATTTEAPPATHPRQTKEKTGDVAERQPRLWQTVRLGSVGRRYRSLQNLQGTALTRGRGAGRGRRPESTCPAQKHSLQPVPFAWRCAVGIRGVRPAARTAKDKTGRDRLGFLRLCTHCALALCHLLRSSFSLPSTPHSCASARYGTCRPSREALEDASPFRMMGEREECNFAGDRRCKML